MFCHSHTVVFLPELRFFLWVSCCCLLEGHPHCSVPFMHPQSHKATLSSQGKRHESLSSLCWCKWSLWRLFTECWWTLIYTTLMMCTAMHNSHHLSQHCSRVDGADLAGNKCPMCWRVSSPRAGVSSRAPLCTHSVPAITCERGKERMEELTQFLIPSLRNAPDTLKKMDFDRLLVCGDFLNSNTWAEGYTRLHWLHQHTISGDPFNEQMTLLSLTSWPKKNLPIVVDRWPSRKHTIQVGKKGRI